ncbi:phosphatidate cytidylyltransferase (CDP-diglyceride synthetase) [unidentified eubacterium SCB49]|nr:phosphatidate cytidylyltransferase (CDP-diglyceride synthetase) [unidentified eubacterium SCB49]
MKELFVRALSGLIYVAMVIIAMFASREWFFGLFFILGIITMYEFLKLVHLKSYLAYLLFSLSLYFLSYSVFDDNAVNLLLILTLFVNLFLLKDILWVNKIPMFEKKKYITVIFYIMSGFIFLTLTPTVQTEYKPFVILGIFILIWANDSFAYLVGKNFGRTKLLERISPKKTVEGFLGGVAGALIAGFLIHKFTEIYELWIWLIISLITSIFGTIGDLVQSKFKRQADVKDSGTIMPGHGGIYDRLDSIIYASPFIYSFLEIAT